jgi:hypothetical protein
LGVVKTGLGCVLGESRRCILGVSKTGLEMVLELIKYDIPKLDRGALKTHAHGESHRLITSAI